MATWRHLRAIVLLPGTVAVVIPAILVWKNGTNVGWGLADGLAVLPLLLGAGLLELGLMLIIRTIALFRRIGRGTLAPWDPTSHLVVLGPYRYVRNPMISGVLCVLLGEAAILGSRSLLIWAAIFFAVNAVYMPLVEERGLRARFGADYDRYCADVPRWLPRLRPWEPEERG